MSQDVPFTFRTINSGRCGKTVLQAGASQTGNSQEMPVRIRTEAVKQHFAAAGLVRQLALSPRCQGHASARRRSVGRKNVKLRDRLSDACSASVRASGGWEQREGGAVPSFQKIVSRRSYFWCLKLRESPLGRNVAGGGARKGVRAVGFSRAPNPLLLTWLGQKACRVWSSPPAGVGWRQEGRASRRLKSNPGPFRSSMTSGGSVFLPTARVSSATPARPPRTVNPASWPAGLVTTLR